MTKLAILTNQFPLRLLVMAHRIVWFHFSLSTPIKTCLSVALNLATHVAFRWVILLDQALNHVSAMVIAHRTLRHLQIRRQQHLPMELVKMESILQS